MKKTFLACLLTLLVIGLSGCAPFVGARKDEDALSPLTRLLPVHRDEDAVPAIIPGGGGGHNTVAITEKGRNPQSIKWLRQSTKSLEKGNWPEAIRTADAAIAQEPALDDAYMIRGLAYIWENMLDRALADCSQAITLNPHNALAYACRGLAHKRKGEAEESDGDLSEASRIAHMATGQVISGDSDDKKATFRAVCIAGVPLGCRLYKNLAGHFPPDIQKRLNTLRDEGNRRFVASDWEGVIQKTTDVLMIDEGNVVALCNRSEAYANKGMLQEAAADSAAAISVDPDFGRAYNSRGWVRELSSQWKDALIDYDVACSRGFKPACTNATRLRTDKKVR